MLNQHYQGSSGGLEFNVGDIGLGVLSSNLAAAEVIWNHFKAAWCNSVHSCLHTHLPWI